jgi:hypothetical protein
VADTKKPDPNRDSDAKADASVTKDVVGVPTDTTDNGSNDDASVAAATAATVESGDTEDHSTGADGSDEIETEAEVLVQQAIDLDEPAKRGGFVPAVLGGVLAALLGFLAAQTDVLDAVLPDAMKNNKPNEALLALQLADTQQAEKLAELRAEIAAIDQPDFDALDAQVKAVQAEISPMLAEIEAQRTNLKNVEERLGTLTARVEMLEKRPMTEGASDSAIAAYDREMTALRDAIAAQRADVEKMIDDARAKEATARALEENAVAATRQAQNQVTVSRLFTALNGGTAYAEILAELASAGVVVPEALNASANDGVGRLAALAESFPTAARASLAAARTGSEKGNGVVGFLQRQLGARSVEPREGDDPDAILSRAEAAVMSGDLPKAIAEIATLPEEARAAMQGWVDVATTRLTALQAADELAQSLNTK